MSDLYLELRSRIRVVAEQTQLGEQRIQEAQTRAGLSNEAVARTVHVSEKTWRRWKKQGSIPTASLPAVARALRLELHELNGDAVTTPSDLARLEAGLAELRRGQERTEAMLAELRVLLGKRAARSSRAAG